MKVKYLKMEALLAIKNNQSSVYKLMLESQSNDWLKDFIGEDSFGLSKITVRDFEMNTSFENPNDSDFANAVILYETFKNLNETQATDERLWAGLAFDKCYNYMIYRWKLDQPTKLTYRWVFYVTNRRKLFYHGLSRLWWFAKMTYDDRLEDPYALTRFVFTHPQIMKAMTYRNYSNNDLIRKSIIKSLIKFEANGGKVNTAVIDGLYKFVSLLSSATLLDAYDEDELTEKIYDKLIA